MLPRPQVNGAGFQDALGRAETRVSCLWPLNSAVSISASSGTHQFMGPWYGLSMEHIHCFFLQDPPAVTFSLPVSPFHPWSGYLFVQRTNLKSLRKWLIYHRAPMGSQDSFQSPHALPEDGEMRTSLFPASQQWPGSAYSQVSLQACQEQNNR